MAAIVTHHALRFSGRARCVQDVKRVVEATLTGAALRPSAFASSTADCQSWSRPATKVAAPAALEYQHTLRLVRRQLDRPVEQRLVGDDPPGFDAA